MSSTPEPRMPLMGLLEPESPEERRAIEMSIPSGAVMVSGSQRSGTRLMCRILEAGGFPAFHDSRHGAVRRPVERVVVMRRDREDALRSISQHFERPDWIDPELSLWWCSQHYPHALHIDYATLCGNPDGVIEDIANWLGTAPWPMPERIVISANTSERIA